MRCSRSCLIPVTSSSSTTPRRRRSRPCANAIKSRAIAFSKTWGDAGDERAETQPFWIDFFAVFGLSPWRLASFEHAVKKHGGGQGFVDQFWPGTLLVEHKSRGKSLDRAFDQALDYFPGIAERDLPRYVLVSDFAKLRISDLVTGDEAEFALRDLHKHIRRFAFIAGYRVQEIKPQDPVNLRAAERMAKLHDALKASGFEGHPLEVLLVRLLFCLFADDTGIFQPAQAFRAWVEERTAEDGSDLGRNWPHSSRCSTPWRPSGRGRSTTSWLPFPTSTALSLPKRCRWPPSTAPCASACSTPARSTGARSARPFSARCSRAS
jgi:hypothetical protein